MYSHLMPAESSIDIDDIATDIVKTVRQNLSTSTFVIPYDSNIRKLY